MDLTQSITPKSDQQNFDDYLSGPRTVTVSAVVSGTDEQPVNVELVEFPGRPYKPSKSMRRVLVAAWGKDASEYVGRRMTLAGDPTVTFGREAVGGIKISALSHIEKRLTLSLTVKRGKRAPHVVEPLPDDAPAPVLTVDDVNAATDPEQLKAMWRPANPELRALIEARVAELTGPAA